MTKVDRAIASEPVLPRLNEPRLEVGLNDVLVALLTSACSLAVLAYGLSAIASVPIFVLLHLAVLIIPAAFLGIRTRHNGELTIAVVLLLATFAAGPVGALGCALTLWRQRPSPLRLQDWYDYIAGVVARGRLKSIHDELISDRLLADPAAQVPRFRPILHSTSIEEQQRVLGVIGRRYHPDFRPVLRKALRNKDGFIRAQAAAVASRLDIEEKNRLWSSGSRDPGGPSDDALDVEARRP
jgi:hypothetical protein